MGFLDKIKKIVFESEETEEQFVDVKTEDGRIMRVDDLAEGQPVMEVTEEGVVEVEDGTYVIVDAEGVPTAEVVVEGGVIASIMDKTDEEEVSEEEMSEESEEESKEESKEEEEEVKLEEEVEISNADLAEALTTVANELKDLKSKFETSEKENAELKKEIEEFKAAPSEEHTKTKISLSTTNKKNAPNSPIWKA